MDTLQSHHGHFPITSWTLHTMDTSQSHHGHFPITPWTIHTMGTFQSHGQVRGDGYVRVTSSLGWVIWLSDFTLSASSVMLTERCCNVVRTDKTFRRMVKSTQQDKIFPFRHYIFSIITSLHQISLQNIPYQVRLQQRCPYVHVLSASVFQLSRPVYISAINVTIHRGTRTLQDKREN